MRSRMDPAGKEKLLSHRRTKKGQPLCDCRFGLGRDLKLQRLPRALQHNTPPLAHATRIPNIADLEAHEIASRQFAVQREGSTRSAPAACASTSRRCSVRAGGTRRMVMRCVTRGTNRPDGTDSTARFG